MLTRPKRREWWAKSRNIEYSIDQRLLVKYTVVVLGNKFPESLIKRLPDDIILEIMERLDPMRLSAIKESGILIEKIRQGLTESYIPIDFSGILFGSTLSFYGRSYISTVSNRRSQRDGLRKLRGRLRTSNCRVAISLDEIGVRDIRTFDPEVSNITADGSPWYRVLNADSTSKGAFEGITDVSW